MDDTAENAQRLRHLDEGAERPLKGWNLRMSRAVDRIRDAVVAVKGGTSGPGRLGRCTTTNRSARWRDRGLTVRSIPVKMALPPTMLQIPDLLRTPASWPDGSSRGIWAFPPSTSATWAPASSSGCSSTQAETAAYTRNGLPGGAELEAVPKIGKQELHASSLRWHRPGTL